MGLYVILTSGTKDRTGYLYLCDICISNLCLIENKNPNILEATIKIKKRIILPLVFRCMNTTSISCRIVHVKMIKW